MFLTTGARWKNRRRLLTPAFHFQILNSFVDVFNEKSVDCARELERSIEIHGDAEFDVFPIMTQCALDIICGESNRYADLRQSKMTISHFFFFNSSETSMGRQTRSEEEKAVYVKNLHRYE